MKLTKLVLLHERFELLPEPKAHLSVSRFDQSRGRREGEVELKCIHFILLNIDLLTLWMLCLLHSIVD